MLITQNSWHFFQFSQNLKFFKISQWNLIFSCKFKSSPLCMNEERWKKCWVVYVCYRIFLEQCALCIYYKITITWHTWTRDASARSPLEKIYLKGPNFQNCVTAVHSGKFKIKTCEIMRGLRGQRDRGLHKVLRSFWTNSFKKCLSQCKDLPWMTKFWV